MKKSIYIILNWLFLSIMFFVNSNCFASHFVGSEITYQCTGTSGIYNVTLKLYRDCSGMEICANCPTSLSSACTIPIEIMGASGTCTGLSFGSATLTVVTAQSGLDVLQLCNAYTSICSNCGTRTAGTITPGIEVYVFTGQVNLSGLTSSCCMVSLNYGKCCRNTSNSTLNFPGSLNYYTEAIINRCASPCNSSPVFKIQPTFVLRAGVEANINIGASDPDGDSLSYALAPSLTAAGTSAPYLAPYSPSVPFSYLGAPQQSPPASLPVGINTNQITGDIRFMPLGNFVSNIVIEVSQWKSIAGVPTLMGKNRRDHQVDAQIMPLYTTASLKKYDTLGNYLGIVPATESITICAGQTICRNYVAVTSNIIDTTDLLWNSPVSMPGATFTPLYNTALRGSNGPRRDSMRFCWSIPSTAASNTPYVAVFIAKSRLCTFPHKSLGTLAIYASASGAPSAAINKALNATNSYKFSYTRNGLNIPDKLLTQWKIETSPNSNVYNTYNNDTIGSYFFSQNGKYRIKLLLTGLCGSTAIITDSVNIITIGVAISSLKNVGCRGDSNGRVIVSSTNAVGPVQYKIGNGNYQSSNTFSNLLPGSFTITGKDSLNLTSFINFTITQPDSFIAISITNMANLKCRGDSSGNITMNVRNGTSPYQYKLGTGNYQSSGSFNNISTGTFMFYAVDSNNCQASATATFTQPDSSISINVTNLTNLRCKGDSSGSVTLIVQNGKAPYQFKMNSLSYQSSNIINKIVAGTQTFYVNDSNSCKATVTAAFTEPATGIILSASTITHIVCRNDSSGAVTLNTINGRTPYQYKIVGANFQSSNIFNGLKAGPQTIMVLDSINCSAYLTVTISQPLVAMSVQSASLINLKCNGDSSGSASFSVNNGKAPYQFKLAGLNYQSSNVFSNLKAGSTTIYVLDSNNCIASKIINLTEPLKLISSLRITSPLCNGGVGGIVLTATGGETPYTYQSDSNGFGPGNNFFNLTPGTYLFSVKDQNNCIDRITGMLTQPAPLIINPQITNIKCNGQNTGIIKLLISGGRTPYLYKFGTAGYSTNNILSNLSTGTYNASVKDSGNCLTSALMSISQPLPLTKSIVTTNTTCAGFNNGTATILLSGGTPPYFYNWKTTPLQTNAKATGLSEGYAIILFNDSNGCNGKDSALIRANSVYNNEKICEVTNDTITGKNTVLWIKTSGVGIATYKVYVSYSVTGPFSLVNVSPFNAFSNMQDTLTGKPSGPCFYYLKVTDSCNVESAASAVHKTMYLEANASAGNKINLTWNSYSGSVSPSNLSLLRSVNGGPFNSIAMLPLSTVSYIDSMPPSGIKRYVTDLTIINNCPGVQTHIYSNKAIIDPTGTHENSMISNNNIDVYPNPTDGLVKIRSMHHDLLLHSVEVYNLPGARVKEQNLQGVKEATIELGDLANGMYHLVVIAGKNKKYVFKVVLNR